MERFEKIIPNIDGVRKEICKYVRKKESEKLLWMNEIDRWTNNEKSLDETKYCNVLESLKKNDAVKDYAISQIVERTERLRTFKSILAIPRASDFNAVVTIDLKEFGKVYELWMVCVFTKMIKGMVMRDKKAETLIEILQSE